MSEGREQLQQAIEGWESRHASAILAQHEADIVLPFLRAAVEELDAFRKNGQRAEGVAPLAKALRAPRPESVAVAPELVATTFKPAAVESEAVDIIEARPTPFSGNNDDEAVNGLPAADRDDEDSEQSDDSISSAFGRKSIASLIQDEKTEAAS